MAVRKTKQTHQTRCEGCGLEVPDFDIVNYGSLDTGYRKLCTKCFNTEVAEAVGLNGFVHPDFAPVELTDFDRKPHLFHFRTCLMPTGLMVEAFEVRKGARAGYHFQVLGDPEEDALALVGRLIAKVRRALAIKHVEVRDYELQIAEQVVRGRIEWDDVSGGRLPRINVDGREITWDQFGRMLMTFEGWQFKLEIRDRTEEV